ncbi:MAG TPA: MarR family transcriptional regulator [Steroidobacteraceae bacterium]
MSSADASILAHLTFDSTVTPGALARHLGIAASSLWARIKHLEALNYLKRSRSPADHRLISLELTPKGIAAASAASVLDSDRLAGLLETLSQENRALAVDGLALLAAAATKFSRR